MGIPQTDPRIDYKIKEIETLQKLQKQMQHQQGGYYDILRDKFERRIITAAQHRSLQNEDWQSTPQFLKDMLELSSPKDRLKEYALRSFIQLQDICDNMENGLFPEAPATVEDYDKLIGESFAETNPSIKDLVRQARTAA